jgi:hypothetical protein
MQVSDRRSAWPDQGGGEEGTMFRAPTDRRHLDPAAIARRLSRVVHWPGAFDVAVRSWRLVAQAPDFDAWLIAWPRGGTIDLHDHGGSRGALHVISGSLVETIPRRDEADRVTFARMDVHEGTTLAFDAGHVHDVRNESPNHALSIHVYSPPLTSMSYYDRVGDHLMAREIGWASSPHDTTRYHRAFLGLVAP